MSESRSFIVSTVVYGAAVGLLSLQGLIVLPLFTQSLGAAEYGVFNQLRVSIALLSPILLLRFDAAAIRFLAGETEPIRFGNIFLTPLAVVVPITITLALLAPLGAPWAARLILDDPARRDVIAAGSSKSALFAAQASYRRTTSVSNLVPLPIATPES